MAGLMMVSDGNSQSNVNSETENDESNNNNEQKNVSQVENQHSSRPNSR